MQREINPAQSWPRIEDSSNQVESESSLYAGGGTRPDQANVDHEFWSLISPNLGRDLNERVPEAQYGVYVGEFLWVGNSPVLAVSDLGPEERREYDQLFAQFVPAQIPEYSNLEEFLADERPIDPETGHLRPGTLNFLGFFQNPESVTGVSHRQKPVWSRLLFLERNIEEISYSGKLTERLRNITSMEQLDAETQRLLLDAYNLMANLVSVNDEDVQLVEIEAGTETGSQARYTAGDYLKR